MTLNEVTDDGEPTGALLNGMPFHDVPATEYPMLGSTEMWEVVNMTADTHPIHIHLVQFQLLNRQKVNVKKYEGAFEMANPELPTDAYVPVDVGPYVKGKPVPAPANERGWKDTYRMNPGEVTRILVRFAPQDESPSYSFDATAEPGYVWHCHILEHEENDMMRPYHLVNPAAPAQPVAGRTVGAADEARPRLWAPQPNPTASGATFSFSLRAPATVELDIYSVTGQRLRQLANTTFGSGGHTVVWDGRDDAGRTLIPGMYFITLRADGVSTTRKLSVTP
jgi:hypothetical protein